MEIAVIFEMNIDFSCLKRYNRYIPKTEGGRRPCQDRHGAVGFVAYHKLTPSAPTGGKDTEPILLTLDEYEVIRLVDLEQQTHEQCATQMDISRSTVQEIYEVARRKIAACLFHGKPLHITGGNYRICGGQEAAHCGRCCRMQRANMEKSGKTCKGDSIMKIAVTYENGQIFQHFGHTEQFKLYEAADG